MLSRLRVLASRIHGWLSSRRAADDFDQEIESHLSLLTEENIRRGMMPEEARRQARLRFGAVAQIQETHRDLLGLPQLDTFLKDMRYALRMLRKSPGFTTLAVLTLALGIGVNTTLFTGFDAIALRPLAVSDPDTVVRVERWFASGNLGNGQYAFSYPEYLYYDARNAVFSSLTAVSWPFQALATMPAASGTEPGRSETSEKIVGELVSANYFSGLGVNAALGRTFLPEENQSPGAHPVIVLSYPFWQRRFNSDPRILGSVLKLNDTAFTVVGVAASDFLGTGDPPLAPDFWAPVMMQAQLVPGQDWLNQPGDYQVHFLARLKPGTGLRQAQAQVAVLAKQFAEAHPEKDKTITVTLQHATLFVNTEDIRFKEVIALLMVVVGMVLLIACANLANMLLARSAGRRKEISVRLAIGASRGRLIRQLLTESIVLALIGGAAGLLLSIWAGKVLGVAIAQALSFWSSGPFAGSLTPDIRVYGYTLLVSLVTGVIFGLSPALQFTKPDLTTALKDEGSSFGPRFSRSRLSSFLVAVQVAVSMLLLICAGLLVRGLVRSQTADPGYDTRKAFMLLLDLGNDPAKARALQRRAIERLELVPEIKSAALVDYYPFLGTWTPPIAAEGASGSLQGLPGRTLANYVSPDYFQTLGVPVIRGRNFTRQEGEQGAPVAVISESTARKFWPGEDPMGRRFKLDKKFTGKFEGELEVIGVAKDVRTANLSRVDPAYVYLATNSTDLYNVLIRAQGDPRRALTAVRAAIETVDRSLLPGFQMISLEEGPLRVQKLMAQAYAAFAIGLACLALALAAVGIYGVMAYLVSQRIKEIGIRMALGASARQVLGSVILQGMRPVFIGAVLGLAGAAGVSSILHSTLVFPGSPDLLFGVRAIDPVTFAGLSVFLAAVAAFACAIPALRATKVDPVVALRYE